MREREKSVWIEYENFFLPVASFKRSKNTPIFTVMIVPTKQQIMLKIIAM